MAKKKWRVEDEEKRGIRSAVPLTTEYSGNGEQRHIPVAKSYREEIAGKATFEMGGRGKEGRGSVWKRSRWENNKRRIGKTGDKVVCRDGPKGRLT